MGQTYFTMVLVHAPWRGSHLDLACSLTYKPGKWKFHDYCVIDMILRLYDSCSSFEDLEDQYRIFKCCY